MDVVMDVRTFQHAENKRDKFLHTYKCQQKIKEKYHL